MRIFSTTTIFITQWTGMLWDAMQRTGKGYRYPPMSTPGGKSYAGAKIRRESKAKMIGIRHGRRL